MTDIKMPELPQHMQDIAQWLETSSDCEVGRDVLNYARSTAEPYRLALYNLVRDLEQRSKLKEDDDDKGIVDCGDGVYMKAKMVLGEVSGF